MRRDSDAIFRASGIKVGPLHPWLCMPLVLRTWFFFFWRIGDPEAYRGLSRQHPAAGYAVVDMMSKIHGRTERAQKR